MSPVLWLLLRILGGIIAVIVGVMGALAFVFWIASVA